MGITPSIENLKKQDQDFSSYLEAGKDHLISRAAPDQDKFTQMVEVFYSQNNWDRQILSSGEYWDIRQTDENSLTSISDTLQSIANSVFEIDQPLDDTAIDDVEAGTNLATELANYQELALSAATAPIAEILGVFNTRDSIPYHSVWQSNALAPGLTLHTWNFGSSFQKEDYFDNQYIIASAIQYKLIYSFDQAAVEQDIEYMESHTLIIEDLENTIEQMQLFLDDMLLKKVPMKKIDRLKRRIDFAKDMLETYRNEVNDLVEGQGGKL